VIVRCRTTDDVVKAVKANIVSSGLATSVSTSNVSSRAPTTGWWKRSLPVSWVADSGCESGKAFFVREA
jgi:hypothetical protein